MPRKPKVPPGEGKNRTIFLRNEQVARLRAQAAELGCDPSDLVRAALDWLLPPTDLDRNVHLRAWVELNWRQLIIHTAVTQALLDGWRGREMHVPVGLPTAKDDARLLPETVTLLRKLGLRTHRGRTPSTRPQADRLTADYPGEALRPAVLKDWAATAPTGLLLVFASPAAMILTSGQTGGPDIFLASRAICTFPEEDSDPIRMWEDQYIEVATSLRVLVREGVVSAVSACVMPPANAPRNRNRKGIGSKEIAGVIPPQNSPWTMYRVDWDAATRLWAAQR
jgi:hypothetical protein